MAEMLFLGLIFVALEVSSIAGNARCISLCHAPINKAALTRGGCAGKLARHSVFTHFKELSHGYPRHPRRQSCGLYQRR
jgi:hypothetical protein